MSFVALELNDIGLVLRREGEGGGLAGPEAMPGAMFLAESDIHLGHDALLRSRSLPRSLHESYWAELSEEVLPPPFPEGLRTADLARHQLGHIFESQLEAHEKCLLAVPGCLAPEQLGLLLGLAVSLDRPFSGLLDSAVAAVAGRHEAGRAVHVDLQLHRMVVTELGADENLERRSVVALKEAGHRQFREAALRSIAALFVEATRFDPLHHVESERQLLDALPRVLAGLAEGRDAEVQLDGPDGEDTLSLSLEAGSLDAAARPVVEQLHAPLAEVEPTEHVFVSSRAARLPGLLRALSDWSGGSVEVLPEDAACEGALDHASHLSGDEGGLPFVLSLPNTRMGGETN